MTERFAGIGRKTAAVMAARLLGCAVLLGALSAPVLPRPEDDRLGTIGARNSVEKSEFAGLASLTLEENALILGRGKTAQERNAEIPLATGRKEVMRAFHAIPASANGYDAALQCLTQAVYYEAANEPLAGQRSVAQVVLNRVQHPAYPSSVCGVVYEGWNQPVCQFSFVCDGALARAPVASLWRQSREVAAAALAGHVEPAVGTATHYHADYVLPRWAFTLAKVHRVGHHLFYRFPGKGGRSSSFTARWNGMERIPQIDFARFDQRATDLAMIAEKPVEPWLQPDPKDRRAENDIGGRMDPSKGWRLSIPDPVRASAHYDATLAAQQIAGGEPL
jgi:spore germination cell wall hydrolase CwlJ-like protein